MWSGRRSRPPPSRRARSSATPCATAPRRSRGDVRASPDAQKGPDARRRGMRRARRAPLGETKPEARRVNPEMMASVSEPVERGATEPTTQMGPFERPAAGPLLSVNNVEVIYDHVILVLKGVSLEVPEGGIVALLGANGAGKSTTLKAISGLLR